MVWFAANTECFISTNLGMLSVLEWVGIVESDKMMTCSGCDVVGFAVFHCHCDSCWVTRWLTVGAEHFLCPQIWEMFSDFESVWIVGSTKTPLFRCVMFHRHCVFGGHRKHFLTSTDWEMLGICMVWTVRSDRMPIV